MLAMNAVAPRLKRKRIIQCTLSLVCTVHIHVHVYNCILVFSLVPDLPPVGFVKDDLLIPIIRKEGEGVESIHILCTIYG